MRIGRKSVLFGLMLVLAGLVLYLAMRNPQAPRMPSDEVHAVFRSPEECLSCHGPQGALPQDANHPISRQCLSCHARAAVRSTALPSGDR
jgi:hypothetical protein